MDLSFTTINLLFISRSSLCECISHLFESILGCVANLLSISKSYMWSRNHLDLLSATIIYSSILDRAKCQLLSCMRSNLINGSISFSCFTRRESKKNRHLSCLICWPCCFISQPDISHSNKSYSKMERPICTHCEIVGHVVDKCYKLHGYLLGFCTKQKVSVAN